MSSSRVAALRRARQRQVRIESATARATRAQTALERAIKVRQLAAERHDERVRAAEAASAVEVVELARVCGSTEAAAEILGRPVQDVRRVLKSEHERSTATSEADARPTRRRMQRLPANGGGSDADLEHR
jgi:hypothetical protein